MNGNVKPLDVVVKKTNAQIQASPGGEILKQISERSSIRYWKRKYAELLECYLWEKEKRHNAEKRGDYWNKVSCVALAALMSLIVSLIFRTLIW